jgi:hypothetical protein
LRHESNHAPTVESAQPETCKRASDERPRPKRIFAGEKGASRYALSRGKDLLESPSAEAPFFFREMNDFKALQRLFLPTSDVTTTWRKR